MPASGSRPEPLGDDLRDIYNSNLFPASMGGGVLQHNRAVGTGHGDGGRAAGEHLREAPMINTLRLAAANVFGDVKLGAAGSAAERALRVMCHLGHENAARTQNRARFPRDSSPARQ